MIHAFVTLSFFLFNLLLHLGAQEPMLPFVLETHTYVVRGNDSLQLDLRMPQPPAVQGTGIVFLHGGGFQTGSRDARPVAAFLDAMAGQGIPSASIDYRLTMAGRGFGCDIPTEEKRRAVRIAAEDAHAALNWLVSADDWPLPKNGWVIAGSSAGAEAALFAAYCATPTPWQGAMSFSGALDAAIRPDSLHPPLFAIHGTCDPLVPVGAALHHFCPNDAPGAWSLIGGPAWADSLNTVGVPSWTHRTCGGGHLICNTGMLDPGVQTMVVQWLSGHWSAPLDVTVDLNGARHQGRASCPQPCN